MATKTLFASLTLCCACLILTGCSAGQVRDNLGLTRESPNEFAVVRRAPLEVPEELLSSNQTQLPKPKLGMARPQEESPDVEARQTLLGKEKLPNSADQLSPADQLFMARAGVNKAQSDIRQSINAETATLHNRNKPVAEKLLGIGGDKYLPSATVVDAEQEALRIQNNKAEGKSITHGETPSIEE